MNEIARELATTAAIGAVFCVFLYFTMPLIMRHSENNMTRACNAFEKSIERNSTAHKDVMVAMADRYEEAIKAINRDNAELRNLFRQEAELQRKHDQATNESCWGAVQRLADSIQDHEIYIRDQLKDKGE